MRRPVWLAAFASALALPLVLQPPAAAEGEGLSAGERAYQKCYSCHSLEGPDPRLQGPSLNGIVGREIAAEEGFTYSPAMRAYAGQQKRWTREALDAFIADPLAVVPGNEMGFFGIEDAEERRALIEYLAGS
jgi:cytochrome c2